MSRSATLGEAMMGAARDDRHIAIEAYPTGLIRVRVSWYDNGHLVQQSGRDYYSESGLIAWLDSLGRAVE